MEKARKNLKEISILILILLGLSIVRMILEIALGGLGLTDIPEGVPKDLFRVTMIAIVVVSFILLLPQLYLGVKGLKVSANPDASKGHIVWAKVLFVFGVIAAISCILDLFEKGNLFSDILGLADIILDLCIYIIYIYNANQVRASVLI